MIQAVLITLGLMQQSLQDLPEPVQKTVQRELGASASIKDVQKEKDGTFKVDTKTTSLHVTAAGDLISKEEDLALDKLPKAVQDAIQKEFGGKKAEAKRVTKISYEAKAGNVRLKFAEDGSIQRREETIKAADLPAAVADAAKAKFNGAKIDKARKILEDGRIRYKVEAANDQSASFTEDGKEIK